MTRKGEKQKGDETQLQRKDVCVCVGWGECARLRTLFGSVKRGSRSGQGASSDLGIPVTLGGCRSHSLTMAVACPCPTPAADAPRSCQPGPSGRFHLAGPPHSLRSRSQARVPFWVTFREVSLSSKGRNDNV